MAEQAGFAREQRNPLRGEAEAVLDGERVTLRAGEAIFLDGANDFAPVNTGGENFSMLITLVRRE